jgi:hypothetical protein
VAGKLPHIKLVLQLDTFSNHQMADVKDTSSDPERDQELLESIIKKLGRIQIGDATHPLKKDNKDER